MIPGCYDPAARRKDMDLDGVWAQLCFPSFARFAGTRFLGLYISVRRSNLLSGTFEMTTEASARPWAARVASFALVIN